MEIEVFDGQRLRCKEGIRSEIEMGSTCMQHRSFKRLPSPPCFNSAVARSPKTARFQCNVKLYHRRSAPSHFPDNEIDDLLPQGLPPFS